MRWLIFLTFSFFFNVVLIRTWLSTCKMKQASKCSHKESENDDDNDHMLDRYLLDFWDGNACQDQYEKTDKLKKRVTN